MKLNLHCSFRIPTSILSRILFHRGSDGNLLCWEFIKHDVMICPLSIWKCHVFFKSYLHEKFQITFWNARNFNLLEFANPPPFREFTNSSNINRLKWKKHASSKNTWNSWMLREQVITSCLWISSITISHKYFCDLYQVDIKSKNLRTHNKSKVWDGSII